MRRCEGCKIADRAELDVAQPCNCGSEIPDPALHADECFKVRHSVRPHWIQIKDQAEWQRKWEAKGWGYKWLNRKHLATKNLCDGCINEVHRSMMVQADYRKACSLAKGERTSTYNQILYG